MRKVYIINRSAHDHSDAERFGELVFLTDGFVDRFDTNNMYRRMAEMLESSSSKDYILLTSLSTLCSIACSMFVYKHGVLNLLLWKDGAYVERIQNIGGLLSKDA